MSLIEVNDRRRLMATDVNTSSADFDRFDSLDVPGSGTTYMRSDFPIAGTGFVKILPGTADTDPPGSSSPVRCLWRKAAPTALAVWTVSILSGTDELQFPGTLIASAPEVRQRSFIAEELSEQAIRGVFALRTSNMPVLFTQDVSISLGELPRWKPKSIRVREE